MADSSRHPAPTHRRTLAAAASVPHSRPSSSAGRARSHSPADATSNAAAAVASVAGAAGVDAAAVAGGTDAAAAAAAAFHRASDATTDAFASCPYRHDPRTGVGCERDRCRRRPAPVASIGVAAGCRSAAVAGFPFRPRCGRARALAACRMDHGADRSAEAVVQANRLCVNGSSATMRVLLLLCLPGQCADPCVGTGPVRASC